MSSERQPTGRRRMARPPTTDYGATYSNVPGMLATTPFVVSASVTFENVAVVTTVPWPGGQKLVGKASRTSSVVILPLLSACSVALEASSPLKTLLEADGFLPPPLRHCAEVVTVAEAS